MTQRAAALFDDPQVRYAHVRSATNNCYICQIDPAQGAGGRICADAPSNQAAFPLRESGLLDHNPPGRPPRRHALPDGVACASAL